MTGENLPFEHRLAKAWLRSNGGIAPDLVESHSELVGLINDFSLMLDIVLPHIEAHKISPDNLEKLSSFIGSLKDRDIEKHYLLSVRIKNQISKYNTKEKI